MKMFVRLLSALAIALSLLPGFAYAEDVGEDDTKIYAIIGEDGAEITTIGGRVYKDDEYISGDNVLYRVVSVDIISCVATAKLIGPEPEEDYEALSMIVSATGKSKSGETEKKLICMYSTHSDESYVNGDGTSSKKKNAGIYDVGEELKKELEAKGIEVEYSKDTFHPHDSGAYRRSRATAEELIKQQPAAIFDIHRDGIPDPKQYDETIEGEDITKVRLLVGRSNPSASSNRSFAKQIKKTADKEYPGLIKDIFIGRGNYNQELYPKSVLLEFGTHTSDKDQVLTSTKYMADILDKAVFGGSASAGDQNAARSDENKSSAAGIAWFIGIAIVAAVAYALVATGTFKGMAYKLGRSVNEITGGIIGKKPDDKDDRS